LKITILPEPALDKLFREFWNFSIFSLLFLFDCAYKTERDMTALERRHVPNHHSLRGGTMAEPNSSSPQKPLVYDLLSRLNASFARVHKNVALLEQSGIFDAQTITRLRRRSEEVGGRREFPSARNASGSRDAKPQALYKGAVKTPYTPPAETAGCAALQLAACVTPARGPDSLFTLYPPHTRCANFWLRLDNDLRQPFEAPLPRFLLRLRSLWPCPHKELSTIQFAYLYQFPKLAVTPTLTSDLGIGDGALRP
jgi:hypothetical protein